MSSNSKDKPIARSEAELARQFADEYAGKVRCRFDDHDRWHWERANAGEWLPVDFNRLLAVVADFGAARFHATGPDGTPYPAPDRGGRAATARGVLNLAAWRLAADDIGGGPLHRAVRNGGDAETLRMLLEAGADVNAQDESGHILLHWARYSRDTEVLRMLLEAGADVSALDQEGKEEGGEFLLSDFYIGTHSDYGHDPCTHYDTLLHWALHNDTEALRMLLEAGADVSAQDWEGSTLLHLAASKGNVAAIRMLLEAGADVNAQDQEGNTPLHLAASGGNVAATRMLLKAGADPEICDYDDRLPSDVAVAPYGQRRDVAMNSQYDQVMKALDEARAGEG